MSKIGNPKYSSVEKTNSKVQEITKTVASIKEVQPFFAEYLKALSKFSDHSKAWLDSGDAVRTGLTKISGVKKYDDIAKSVKGVDTCLMDLFKQRMLVVESYQDNVLKKWGEEFAKDKSVAEFEKSFKTKRANSLKRIKKAESNHAKASKPRAMKKAPEKADAAKKELDDAVNDHEEMLSQELHLIVLLERKRYASFLRQISLVLGDEAKALKECEEVIAKCHEELAPGIAADSEDNFPVDLRKLIGPQELARKRSGSTLVAASNDVIKNESNGHADDDDDDDDHDDSDGSGDEKHNHKEKEAQKQLHSDSEEESSSSDEADAAASPRAQRRKDSILPQQQVPPPPSSPPAPQQTPGSIVYGQVAPMGYQGQPFMAAPPPAGFHQGQPFMPAQGQVFMQPQMFPPPQQVGYMQPLDGGSGMLFDQASPAPERREATQHVVQRASTAGNTESLTEYLQKLDAPAAPATPVREEDMEDELSRILSSFDSVQIK